MANYGSKDLIIELTDSGAVSRDITQFVRAINGVEIKASTEESHSFGDQWREFLYTGFSSMEPVTLDGIYDDAALTPYALWSRGATRVLKVTFGGGHYVSVSVILQSYKRGPELEKAHKYSMTVQPTGTVTEA